MVIWASVLIIVNAAGSWQVLTAKKSSYNLKCGEYGDFPIKLDSSLSLPLKIFILILTALDHSIYICIIYIYLLSYLNIYKNKHSFIRSPQATVESICLLGILMKKKKKHNILISL